MVGTHLTERSSGTRLASSITTGSSVRAKAPSEGDSAPSGSIQHTTSSRLEPWPSVTTSPTAILPPACSAFASDRSALAVASSSSPSTTCVCVCVDRPVNRDEKGDGRGFEGRPRRGEGRRAPHSSRYTAAESTQCPVQRRTGTRRSPATTPKVARSTPASPRRSPARWTRQRTGTGRIRTPRVRRSRDSREL